MRVLVTGGAGFIGSHITNRLLKEGHEVIVIDSFSDYYSPQLKFLRVKELIEPFGGRVVRIDIADPTECKRIVAKFEPTSILHLAAQPGIRLKPQDYGRYTRDNLLSFSNLFQIIIESGVKNFIYASSSSVYGNSTESVLNEEMVNLRPVSYYGGTKLANEILTRSIQGNSDISYIGLRFFTVYGPYGRPDMAYFRLISQALTNYKFELYGDGNVHRDFTFIGDTVEALYRLMIKQDSNELRGNSILNIGGGNPASMLEMISEVELLSGKQLKYKCLSAHSGDVHSTNASTEKLKSAIGYVPQTELKHGLNTTFEWSAKPGIIRNLEDWARSVN